jgi:tetratricopeptide (TPR) repeat protein
VTPPDEQDDPFPGNPGPGDDDVLDGDHAEGHAEEHGDAHGEAHDDAHDDAHAHHHAEGEDDGHDHGDEEAAADGRDEVEPGYLWTFSEQEERLGEDYGRHMGILDDLEAREILDLDLGGSGDYLLWAAAQSLEEQGWTGEALAILRRLDASREGHPALSYAEIRLRLHDLLRERGDYVEALQVLERVEHDDPVRRDACRERHAEVLVLTGRKEEGLRMYEKVMRSVPDDPWPPLNAAWALIRAGDYDLALSWIGRGERAANRLEDEEEAQPAANEIERLRNEARIRRERRQRATGEGPESVRQAILADLDAEEVRLTREPPQSETDRAAALARLVELHQRASAGWDDAVERHDEAAISTFDDLGWEVVEVAERFGLRIPGTDEE